MKDLHRFLISCATLTAKKKNSINFSENNKKFCLNMQYNGANSYLFVNGREIHKFKTKFSENMANPLCLGSISKDFSVYNMRKRGLNGFVSDSSVDYDVIAVDNILDIDKWLNEKIMILYKIFGFV